MPTITVDFTELCTLLNKKLDKPDFRTLMLKLGCGISFKSETEVAIDYYANRPDLSSIEGLARFIGSYLGLFEPYYISTIDSGINIYVDERLKFIRPYIAGAWIENIEVDERKLKSIIDMQEKLHETIGRKRKKVAIGIHDSSRLKPPFYYKAFKGDEIKFIPLGKTVEMNLDEILNEHEKGIAYRHIFNVEHRTSNVKPLYPVIVDSENQILSFPPIINGTLTEVVDGTKKLFIDVTGTDLNAVLSVLHIICSSFAFYGAKIYNVTIEPSKLKTPVNEIKKKILDINYANKILGTSLTNLEAQKILKKMGLLSIQKTDSLLEVQVPQYRTDILHSVDLIEELLIAYGYENISQTLPERYTYGEESPDNVIANRLRYILTSTGYLEVRTLILTNEKLEYINLNLETSKERTIILNPITTETTGIRTSLIPGLLNILRFNKHRQYPQNIFEVGYIVNQGKNELHLGIIKAEPKVNFLDMKGLVTMILDELNIKHELELLDKRTYISGRSASILIQCSTRHEAPGTRHEIIGEFGEVYPSVLENFELKMPCGAIEFNISKLPLQSSKNI